jgi:hypothetical protein
MLRRKSVARSALELVFGSGVVISWSPVWRQRGEAGVNPAIQKSPNRGVAGECGTI